MVFSWSQTQTYLNLILIKKRAGNITASSDGKSNHFGGITLINFGFLMRFYFSILKPYKSAFTVNDSWEKTSYTFHINLSLSKESETLGLKLCW